MLYGVAQCGVVLYGVVLFVVVWSSGLLLFNGSSQSKITVHAML